MSQRDGFGPHMIGTQHVRERFTERDPMSFRSLRPHPSADAIRLQRAITPKPKPYLPPRSPWHFGDLLVGAVITGVLVGVATLAAVGVIK